MFIFLGTMVLLIGFLDKDMSFTILGVGVFLFSGLLIVRGELHEIRLVLEKKLNNTPEQTVENKSADPKPLWNR
ncbi:MAG: hypothetical protein UT30_C0001G0021 [Candidatus Uhrbacteria bacterium GW2011_GWF2_39_13]|uniref:Uncharacterized protein n=1 Tax=Candidatus Uhrbacteria bacterium GW2011_GWF2_39_13 TaxID=1618995 RepID=A0A0G0QTW4_9BACT|nr:MAG: hypothetical protein UT30_C0001G0021 [Candidatus Uhrbacteria bacterium GW2011_GWF2_39_13]HAU66346.1 hypothetical protein [Candidatus Uhrbacteria bacterium]